MCYEYIKNTLYQTTSTIHSYRSYCSVLFLFQHFRGTTGFFFSQYQCSRQNCEILIFNVRNKYDNEDIDNDYDIIKMHDRTMNPLPRPNQFLNDTLTLKSD